jgi:hypothetical protein
MAMLESTLFILLPVGVAAAYKRKKDFVPDRTGEPTKE